MDSKIINTTPEATVYPFFTLILQTEPVTSDIAYCAITLPFIF